MVKESSLFSSSQYEYIKAQAELLVVSMDMNAGDVRSKPLLAED